MKKILYEYPITFDMLDPKDYIIIEEDDKYINDKYVDWVGDKINEYKNEDKIKKGDVVTRVLYYIWFGCEYISINFKKFKYYDIYRNSNELTSKLKKDIRMKNSFFDFNHIKNQIVKMFSGDIKINQ